jgi:S-methylmethionine-dependent homocysteine/selenocysteine methylase
VIAIQDKVISTNNYNKYILKDSNIANDTRRKCREKSETIQHRTGPCRALIQGDYTHRHSEVVNIVENWLSNVDYPREHRRRNINMSYNLR